MFQYHTNNNKNNNDKIHLKGRLDYCFVTIFCIDPIAYTRRRTRGRIPRHQLLPATGLGQTNQARGLGRGSLTDFLLSGARIWNSHGSVEL